MDNSNPIPKPKPKPGPSGPSIETVALIVLIKDSAKQSKARGLSEAQAVEEAERMITQRYVDEVNHTLVVMAVAEVYRE